MAESQLRDPPLTPDPLTARGFDVRHVDLGLDVEGPYGCTLVMRSAAQWRALNSGEAPTPSASAARLVHGALSQLPDGGASIRAKIARDRAFVLYLHGWSDYFFHDHVASAFNAAGFDFCAVDLRKYGRSLREHHTATAIDTLEDYCVEIGAAIAAMSEECEGPRVPLVYAHSTGGLTAALWAADHPGECSGLIFNSPWLDMHGGPVVRSLAAPIVDAVVKRDALRRILPSGHDFYARAHRSDRGGEWDWHDPYKPAHGFPFPASTLAAVIAAQARVATNVSIRESVLVATSHRSSFRLRWADSLVHADTVIDVRSTRRRAHHLGPRVRRVTIPGAAHDIALSTVGPRHHFLREVADWLATEWIQGGR